MIFNPQVEQTATGARISFMASSKADADRFCEIFHRRLLETSVESQMQRVFNGALLGEPKGLLGGVK
jgi:hypothetical protein